MVGLMNFKRTKNYYLTKRKFISFASWKDSEDMFVIFPTIMCKRKQDRGLEVVLSQYLLMWGHRKIEIDLGSYFPRKKEYSWTRLKMDSFLDWTKKNIDKTLTREYIEMVLEDNSALKKTLSKSDPGYHYMKLMLDNEIKKFKQLNDISPEMLKNSECLTAEGKELENVLKYPNFNKKNEEDLLDILSNVIEEDKST